MKYSELKELLNKKMDEGKVFYWEELKSPSPGIKVIRVEIPKDELTIESYLVSIRVLNEGTKDERIAIIGKNPIKEEQTTAEPAKPQLPREVIDKLQTNPNFIAVRDFYVAKDNMYEIHCFEKCENDPTALTLVSYVAILDNNGNWNVYKFRGVCG